MKENLTDTQESLIDDKTFLTEVGKSCASARSAELKEQVATLQNELAKLAGSQATMDQLRREEHEAYVASKAEQEKGLEGIKLALNLLKEYYASDAAHTAAVGAASGIVGLETAWRRAQRVRRKLLQGFVQDHARECITPLVTLYH